MNIFKFSEHVVMNTRLYTHYCHRNRLLGRVDFKIAFITHKLFNN